MSEFNTFTVGTLKTILSEYNNSLLLGLMSDYGDRSNTMQAIPLAEFKKAGISTTNYSDSGYRVVQEGEGEQEILLLNYNQTLGFESVTVGEAQVALEQYEDDLLVAVEVNYGNRINTMQAVALTQVDKASINETAYSDSGYRVLEEGIGEQEILLLNYDEDLLV